MWNYNINDSLIKYALKKENLELISTGGNIDYVCRIFQNGMDGIISAVDDAGSPENMSSSAKVILFTNGEWIGGVSINFKNVRLAMNFLDSLEEFSYG